MARAANQLASNRAWRCALALVLSLHAVLLFLVAPVGAASYEIRGGGTPVLINAIGGSITGGSFNQHPFSVTVNFGEVGPANQNGIVAAIIPLQLRSSANYDLSAQVTASSFSIGDPEAVQSSDIGFGLQNIRGAGNGAGLRTNPDPVTNSNILQKFNNDPQTSVNLSGLRATFPSTLNDIASLTSVMSGPRISSSGSLGSNTCGNCGILVDVILAVKPQYFSPGGVSVTISFTIN